MIFVGHEHYLAQQAVSYNGSSPAHIFCGGCLCNKGCWHNSQFFACMFDTEDEVFKHYAFTWDQDAGIYRGNEPNPERIVIKPSTDIPTHVNQDFLKKITHDSTVGGLSDLSDYYILEF